MGSRSIDNPAPPPGQGILGQRHWRAAGAACILAAGFMAYYAATSGLLRESVLHAVTLLTSRSPGDVAPVRSGIFQILYWLAFAVIILVSVYCAVLDMRYIRHQFASERREIFNRTLGDPAFRESLVNTPERNGRPSSPESPPSNR